MGNLLDGVLKGLGPLGQLAGGALNLGGGGGEEGGGLLDAAGDVAGAAVGGLSPIGLVGGGLSMLGGLAGSIFGKTENDRVVDPFIEESSRLTDKALNYAKTTRDSAITTAYQHGDQASNQVQKTIGGNMMNKTGRSDTAMLGGIGNATRAMSRNQAQPAVTQAHNQYQQSISQAAQDKFRDSTEVHYDSNPNLAMKIGAGLKEAPAVFSEGALAGLNSKDMLGTFKGNVNDPVKKKNPFSIFGGGN